MPTDTEGVNIHHIGVKQNNDEDDNEVNSITIKHGCNANGDHTVIKMAISLVIMVQFFFC